MASTPYIAFTEFFSRADRTLDGWSTFRDHVRSGARSMAARTGLELPRTFDPRLAPLAPLASAAGDSLFRGGIWRLLALNNREVARSLFLYESVEAANGHVLKLQRSSVEFEIHLIRGPVSMQHGWYATTNGVAVMSCGRWYPASGLCLESAAYCVEALRTARVAPDAAPTPARALAARALERARARGGATA